MSSKTFFDEMRSFVILFLIFGLMPIWKNGKFKYLLLTHFILSVGFIFGIIVSFFFINDVIQENNLSSVVSLSFLFSAIFTHLIVLLQAFVYRSKQIKLFEIFHNVDKLFRNKLQSHNLYAREKRQLFRQLSIILSILLTIKICLIISVASYAIFWYHCLYSIFIIRVTCIQIIYFVNLLKNRLVLVDEKLKEIIIGQSIANNGISIYSDKQALRQNIIFILDNSYSKCTIYERLIYLKRVYGKLYEICEVINQAFGWSLLAITAQGFIDFTGCSYWTFLALEQTNQSFYKVTFNIYLLVPTVVILTAMASYCSSCAQMTQSIASTLNRINRDNNNEILNDLIREFSLQIIHEPIFITANGFFNIDFDLLGSMAAATVTYLVILIQFELSDKD